MHINPIVIIAIVICALAVAFYFIRLGMDKRKLEQQGVQRSIEDAERQKRMKEPWPPPGEDDTTKTWPGPPATV